MKLDMLEHQKLVLKNISYDKDLFRKELSKSVNWLKTSDLYKLFEWLRSKYWETHEEIIVKALRAI